MIRDARRTEALRVADLAWQADPEALLTWARSRRACLRMLALAAGLPGTLVATDVTRVAVRDGSVLGAAVVFPAVEAERRFCATLLCGIAAAPWRARVLVETIETTRVLVGGPGAWVLDCVAVSAGARRRGIGRALVKDAVGRARLGGADSVSVWAAHGNDAALELYRSCGFVAVGDDAHNTLLSLRL